MYRTDFGTQGEGEGGMFWENSIETSILSRMKQITSPGWMHETSAQGWCIGRPRGMGWGGRREGGLGWGIHVNPWLIHVTVWQKPLQYYKVISLQLIKINEKKKTFLKCNYGGLPRWSSGWEATCQGRTCVPSLARKDSTCCGMTNPWEPQLLSPHSRAHAPQREKAPQWEARIPQLKEIPARHM